MLKEVTLYTLINKSFFFTFIVFFSLLLNATGLFINGNINFLAKHSIYWLNIKTKLEQMNAVNTHLPLLLCRKHNQRTVVGTHHDLEKILKNGLCNEKCSCIMECGHECAKLCHNILNVLNEHKCLSC